MFFIFRKQTFSGCAEKVDFSCSVDMNLCRVKKYIYIFAMCIISSLQSLCTVQKVDPELLDLAVSPSDPPLKPALTPSSSSNQSSSSSSSQKKSPTALDEILKHSSSSMVKQKPKRETGLSSEANSVLDSLPDLSYMLAKVLMFPVASSNSSSPSKLPKSDAVQGTGWAESIS